MLHLELGQLVTTHQLDELSAEQPFVYAPLEILEPLFVIRGALRIHFLETDLDVVGNDHRPQGVGVDVGIAEDVDVPTGSTRVNRHLQHGHAGRHGDVAYLTFANTRVAGLVDHRRHPELQVQTGVEQQVGPAEHHGIAGLGLDEVGVLPSLGDGGHHATLADDLLCYVAVNPQR